MGNVLRVLGRDIKRLAKTPPAWLVILFLAVLPSLYTWFNVAAFWDPYNNTGNLRVCVVNEDEGASIEEIGDLHLGDQIVEQLKQNDQLGWAFVDKEEAEDEVRTGQAYAAFVMPAGFSADVGTILSGDFHQPRIEYLVNEKVGPVAPKITDTGANSLDATINDTFVSVVSEVVATIIDEKLSEAEKAGGRAKTNALAQIEKARSGIADTRKSLEDFTDGVIGAKDEIATAKESLSNAKGQLDQLSSSLNLTAELADNASLSLVGFSASIDSILEEGSQNLSQTTAKTNLAIVKGSNSLLSAKGSIDGAIARGQSATQEIDKIAESLEDLKTSLPSPVDTTTIDEAVTRLSTTSSSMKNNLTGLRKLSDDTAEAAATASNVSDTVNVAAQDTLENADEFRETLNGSTIPAISDALSSLSRTGANLSVDAANQKGLIDQSSATLDELSTTMETTANALRATDGKLESLENELATLKTDLSSIGVSGALARLIGTDHINPESIAEFMMSPTRIITEELYPLNAYGSSMAPLFINLTLWIGVFMLMVIMRLEVDDEGIKRLTIAQRFFGRYLLLAPIACVQAAICCTGCIALGVQTANVAVFYITAIIASLAYLSIQYALSTTLQHVGKAVCIILVFVQIPGATGLYPIEMTPEFFRVVYPLFPFTYGINAMRETISGFYDGQWFWYIGVLFAFLVAFMLIGSIARPYLANLNRMFAREIEESDILVGETVELPARRWRMSQVLHMLSDRDEYRVGLEQRVDRFMKLYPQLKQAALFLGIIVPVITTAILAPLGFDKVVILTSWLAWLILIITLLIIVEFFRDNLSHQVSLEYMEVDEVRTLFGESDRFTRVKPLDKDVAESDGGASERGDGDKEDEHSAADEGGDKGREGEDEGEDEDEAREGEVEARDNDEKRGEGAGDDGNTNGERVSEGEGGIGASEPSEPSEASGASEANEEGDPE